MRFAAFAAVMIAASTAAAAKSPTLTRIKQDGVVRCGSAIRPGLAFPAPDHSWHGLHIELCRAVAVAVLGDPDKIAFSGYVLGPDFGRIRRGEDDVAFLTATELFSNELFGALSPGPAVFQLSTALMVAYGSPVLRLSDLKTTMVCAEPGTTAERGLRAQAAAQEWELNFSGWMELEEMMDAFDAGRCPAVAGEVTALAALRLGSAQKGREARILDEPLSVAPVLAMTPMSDPAWSNLVTWTVNTVLAGPALPIAGEWVGLDKSWQARVASQGSYAAMVQRSLGNGSPLGLPAGVNTGWQQGGLLVPPAVE